MNNYSKLASQTKWHFTSCDESDGLHTSPGQDEHEPEGLPLVPGKVGKLAPGRTVVHAEVQLIVRGEAEGQPGNGRGEEKKTLWYSTTLTTRWDFESYPFVLESDQNCSYMPSY